MTDYSKFKQWLENMDHYSESTIRAIVCDIRTLEEKYSKLPSYPDLTIELSKARVASCKHAYGLYKSFLRKEPPFEEPLYAETKRKERKRRQKDAVSIDIDEWLRICDYLESKEDVEALVLLLMASTGLRVGDVLRLERSSLAEAFKRKDGLLKIVVKGQRPIYSTVRGPVEQDWQRLQAALEKTRAINVAELISPAGGGNWQPAGSAYQAIRRYWKSVCLGLSIPGEHNLHRIRRTVAVLLQRNAGIQYAQHVLGHESEKTTRLYVDEIQADTIKDGLERLASLRQR